jgi:hypothetical protein
MMCRAQVIAGLTLCVTALWAAPLTAEIYKWVDDNGKLHYGDRPPADVKSAREVKIKTTPVPATPTPSSAARLDRQKRMLNAYANERADRKQAAKKEKEQKAQLARRCVEAKDQLALMKESGSLYTLNDAGERVYRSDRERESSIKAYEDGITKNCR